MGGDPILIGLPHRGGGHGRRVKNRRHVGKRHGKHPGLEADFQSRGVADRERFAHGRATGNQDVAGSRAAEVEPPLAGGRVEHPAHERGVCGEQGVNIQNQRHQQVVRGEVRDDHIVGHGVRHVVRPAGAEADVDVRREIGDGLEIRGVDGP